MSLLQYMEKDIARKIKLVEFVYSKSQCSIHELERELNITRPTLKRDFEKINEDLNDFIVTSEMSNKVVNIIFTNNVSLLQITNVLYKQSPFIRFLYRCLLNPDISLTELAQLEFLSENQCKKIYQQVSRFLEEKEIMQNELRYRLLLTCMYAKVDDSYHHIDLYYWNKAKKGLRLIFNHNIMYFNPLDEDLFLMTIYLSLIRYQKHPLALDHLQFEYLKNDFIFQQLKSFYVDEVDGISEKEAIKEAILITIIFYQFVNYKDFTIAQTMHNTHWNQLTQQHMSIHHLYIQLIMLNTNKLIDELSFQRNIIKLLFNSWLGLEVFTTHFLIDHTEYSFINFQRTINRWKDEDHIPFILQENNIIELYYFYQNMLLTHDNYYTCNIVVTNQNQFTFFFNFLYKYLSSSQFKINSQIFYSLDDVPKELFHYPYLIICEHSLYDENMYHAKNVFPFSINNIRQDTQNMLNQLFKQLHD